MKHRIVINKQINNKVQEILLKMLTLQYKVILIVFSQVGAGNQPDGAAEDGVRPAHQPRVVCVPWWGRRQASSHASVRRNLHRQ